MCDCMFSFMRNCQAIFQNAHIILYLHQQFVNDFFPHVCQNLLLSLFFILAPLRFVQ